MAVVVSDKAALAAEELRQHFIFYSDFPKKGIMFWFVDMLRVIYWDEPKKSPHFSRYLQTLKLQIFVGMFLQFLRTEKPSIC